MVKKPKSYVKRLNEEKIVNFHTAASLSSSSSCHQHRLIAILIIFMIVFINILNVHGHSGKEKGEQGVVRDPRTVTSSAPVELEPALVKRPRARPLCYRRVSKPTSTATQCDGHRTAANTFLSQSHTSHNTEFSFRPATTRLGDK